VIPTLTEREREVLGLLTDDPQLSVNQLAVGLSVSQVSIRNYLNSLAEKGFLTRIHGGAVTTFHPGILERTQTQTEVKGRIARAAADLVSDGDTIMVEAGTTTALIVRYLLGKRDITIVTNNTLVLAYTRGNPGIHLTVTGGEFRPATESLVGPLTLEDLMKFHVKTAFVGTDGFSPALGLTTHIIEGAEVVRAMASHAQQTVAVADSTKFGRAGFVHVLPLHSIDILVTDTGLPEAAVAEITETGIDVRCV